MRQAARYDKIECMKKIIRYIGIVLCWLMILSVVQVAVLRFVPITRTPLMVLRKCEAIGSGRDLSIRQHWRKLSDISPNMQNAVIAAEDSHFYEHGGFSAEGIERAVRELQEGQLHHGGSTISQQTAKNVFCLPHRTYLRKAVEAYYTVLIELLWGKDRILEVYLNVAEMGDGIFGAEAAAQQYFHTSAAILTREQSALIAVCLPNPRRMSPAIPTTYITQRQQTILRQF